jgi:hypothetical protein
MTFAHLSGIDMVENVRVLDDKPNTVVFDAQFYAGGVRGIMAHIEFYNRNGLKLESDAPIPVLIDAIVCQHGL